MASKGKASPPLRSRPPPDPPPFTNPPMPFVSLLLTEPPDPPDAIFILVLIPFVDESHTPSPPTVSQVVDLESPASATAFRSTSVVTPCMFTSRELSSTGHSILLPFTDSPNLALQFLQSSGVEVLFLSTFELLNSCHRSCSDLEDLVFTMAIRTQELENQPELYLSNSAIRAWFVPLQDIRVDVSVLVRWLAVPKPLSLQYAALQSLEDWTLDVDTVAVVCFVDTGLLNDHNSDTFHCLASDYRVHLAQSLFSVLVYGAHLAHSQYQSQGKAKVANKVLSFHQDRVRQAPRSHLDSSFVSCMTDATWNKEKSTAGLGLVFSGPSFISLTLIAEAITIRLALCMALTFELSTLKVFSDSLTLNRVISGNLQYKEIIVIRSISSGVAALYFYLVSKSDNLVADVLENGSSSTSLFVSNIII